MRIAQIVLPLAIALTLGACASTGTSSENSYVSRERRLADDCRERGGILAPTGQQSGRPEADNVCKITGQPARAGG